MKPYAAKVIIHDQQLVYEEPIRYQLCIKLKTLHLFIFFKKKLKR